VFFVKDVFGLKIDHEKKLAEIRKALTHVLQHGDVPKTREPAQPRAKISA
jgi:hypothetical protein